MLAPGLASRTLQPGAGPAATGRGQAGPNTLPAAAMLAALSTVLPVAWLLIVAATATVIFTAPSIAARSNHVRHVRGVKDRGRSQRH